MPSGEAVRPAAPVEYDVLVGELASLETRFEEARAAYLRAARKDPDSAYLQRKLAGLALKLDDLEAAAVHATRAFALEPEDEHTRLFLARIHRIRLDIAGVESVLLVDGEPVSPRAMMLLYQVYLERSRLSEALEFAQLMVDQQPEMLDGHMALATVYEHLGRRGEAVQAMRAALVLHPDRPILYSRLARTLRAMTPPPPERVIPIAMKKRKRTKKKPGASNVQVAKAKR